MTFTANGLEALILGQLSTYAWPFFRITGLLMIAPVFGTRLVPARVKIALAVALTAAIAPAVEAPQDAGFSVASALIAAHELLLGIVLGFVLQLLFDALVIAGQTIAMTMGLGFATMVDPQRGVSVPLLSQFFVILGILVFLALDGHLALLALLVVNIAFGVMSRAAPTLNLFAVGFPTALLLGIVFLLLDVGGFVNVFSQLLDTALLRLGDWLGLGRLQIDRFGLIGFVQ